MSGPTRHKQTRKKHGVEQRPGAGPAPRTDERSADEAVEQAMEHAASRQQPPASVQSVQPEDSTVLGASGSLQRELLGLNVDTHRDDGQRPEAQPGHDTPSGQHATGSSPARDGDKPVEEQ